MSNSIKRLGWVALNRSILDEPIFTNSNLLKIYIWCMLKANHSSTWAKIKTGKGYMEEKVHRGSFITGRIKASDELQVAPSTYINHLKKLVGYGFVEVKSRSHFTKIKVIGYPSNQSSNDHI